MGEVKVKQMHVDDLIPYENNPRNNDKAVKSVAESIKQFGFKVPIVVDEHNVIITGHTRLKAVKELGIDEVPVIVADDLTEKQIQAFRLADNKTAELAEWDITLLNEELDALFEEIDMNQFGFPVQIENIDEDHDGEYKISAELGEADNYVVLKFSDELDWEKAITVLGLEKVSTNEENKKVRRVGIGRVIEGNKVVDRLSGTE